MNKRQTASYVTFVEKCEANSAAKKTKGERIVIKISCHSMEMHIKHHPLVATIIVETKHEL